MGPLRVTSESHSRSPLTASKKGDITYLKEQIQSLPQA